MATSALLLAALLPGGSVTVVAQDADEGARGSECIAGWRTTPLPASVDGSRPYEVVVEDGELAWLIGGADGGPLVLRREDGDWRQLDTSSKRVDADAPVALLDATPAPDGTIWAAGYARPGRGVMEPYAGRLTSSRWKQRRVSDAPGSRVALAGIAAKGEEFAWAVGTKLRKGRTRAYALRWDGDRWVEQAAAPKSRESALTAVASTPGGNVWAVGWATAKSGYKRPLIAKLRADGAVRIASPRLPEGTAVLTDVSFPGGANGWASGYLIEVGSSQHRPFVAHWDGDAWSATLVPWNEEDSGIPRALAVTDDGAIWLAGTLLASDVDKPRGFVLHAPDGADGEWQLHDDMPLAAGRSELFSVAVTADGAVVSGIEAGGGQPVVLETCDGSSGSEAGTASAMAAAAWGGAAGSSGREGSTLVAGERRLPPPAKPDGFRIRDVSEEAGLGMEMNTLAGMAEDLDADGWDDLYVWAHGFGHIVMRGGPDGFEPGPSEAFGSTDRHRCTAADVDEDGRLDVFCSSGRARGSAIDRHELSLAPGYEGGGVAPDLLGIEDPFGRGRAATFIQLDDDGLPDLFVTNSPDRGDALPGTNRFYRNVGGRFAAAPEVGLDLSTGGWCAVAADIDGDGDHDLLHCQEHSDDGRDEGLRIQRNDEGTLRERSRKLGIEPIGDIDVIVADMTGDGRADVVQLSRTRLRLSRGTRRGTFKAVYEVLTPFAQSMASGDVDGDGALDLYVVAGSSRGNETDLLLVNDGRGKSFTSVRVPQGESGSGADVLALDYDDNGLTDFVVLDGRGSTEGPVRLLASFPAP